MAWSAATPPRAGDGGAPTAYRLRVSEHVDASAFARYLDDVLDGRGYWEKESVILPTNVCVAVLSLLQYLSEDITVVPKPLLRPTVRLNNLIGAEVQGQANDS